MRVFLSYDDKDSAVAERVFLALREAGHEVFYDRASLPAGEAFHTRIREQVAESDLFVFLVSSTSLQKGCYCLTELDFAKQRWPNQDGHVLPVLIESMQASEMPALLTSVTYLEPKGNLVAETAAAVDALARRLRRRRIARVGAAVAVLAVLGAGGLIAHRLSVEPGPIHALAGGLRHRVRVASASSGVGEQRLLLALDGPPELIAYAGRDEVRTIAKLDAEPVALAQGDQMLAIATRSSTPIHLFRGDGFEPLPPLAVEFNCDGCDEHPDSLATQPVELAVFNDCLWVQTLDKDRAPGFNVYTYLPGVEQWKPPFYGSSTYEQLIEFGEWAQGGRMRVINDHVWELARYDDHSILVIVDEEFMVFRSAPDSEFACARDLAPYADKSFVLVSCDNELVRLTKSESGDFEPQTLGKLELPDGVPITQLDHRIACAPGRVLLTFTAYDNATPAVALWTQLTTWAPLEGVHNLRVFPDQESMSIATTSDRGLVVLRGTSNVWDAFEIDY